MEAPRRMALARDSAGRIEAAEDEILREATPAALAMG